MTESTEQRTDLVILGAALIVLGVTLADPGGAVGRLLCGWLILLGLCTIIRSVTAMRFPEADRLLRWFTVATGLAGMIGAIIYAIFF